MLMNSKDLLKVKNKLKKFLKQKEVLDVILFGSAVKGKFKPNDIDIAILTKKKDIKFEISEEFHVSLITLEDFFKSISLINTLLREGISIKHNKPFSEIFNFSNRVLFVYKLTSLSNSDKVRLVNVLRGKKGEGLIKKYKGEWLANQVFLVSVENERIFEELFLRFKIKYKKSYVLIH